MKNPSPEIAGHLPPIPIVADGIDADALWERVPRPLLAGLVEIYRKDSARLLSDIEGAIVRRDGRQLEYSAHALKGPTLTFAATMAGPTTEELERSGQTNDFTAATRLLERLRGEIGGLIEGLTRLVETTPP